FPTRRRRWRESVPRQRHAARQRAGCNPRPRRPQQPMKPATTCARATHPWRPRRRRRDGNAIPSPRRTSWAPATANANIRRPRRPPSSGPAHDRRRSSRFATTVTPTSWPAASSPDPARTTARRPFLRSFPTRADREAADASGRAASIPAKREPLPDLACRPALLEGAPDALRRRRHLDLLGLAAEPGMVEGVDHRVHRRRRRADRAELADALDAERVEQARDRGI